MPTTPSLRPGGRSARVQAAVHAAVHALIASHGREALTLPLIAARAGVTPSTLYRRWGDLAALLADVSVERMRPDAPPADTGSFRGDLRAWAEQYHEEMGSDVGRGMLHDVLSAAPVGGGPSCQCAIFTEAQIAAIVARAAARGEPVPAPRAVVEAVVAPLLYRQLFGPAPATPADVARWVDGCVARAAPADGTADGPVSSERPS